MRNGEDGSRHPANRNASEMFVAGKQKLAAGPAWPGRCNHAAIALKTIAIN